MAMNKACCRRATGRRHYQSMVRKPKDDHFDRHGQDFGGPHNADSYEQNGSRFMNSDDTNILEKTRPNGDEVRFNPQTDEFGVTSQD